MVKTVVLGDLFASTARAWVNPVNCVGVSGRGLAKAFKSRFPHNHAAYAAECARGGLKPGGLFPVFSGQLHPEWIVNFATKNHWRDHSKLSAIHYGLLALDDWCVHAGVRTVALPAVGCGLGGLAWEPVDALVHDVFGKSHGVVVTLYAPL